MMLRGKRKPKPENTIGHITAGDVLDDLGLDKRTAAKLKLRVKHESQRARRKRGDAK